jgi:farnesyl diphosphate synthase
MLNWEDWHTGYLERIEKTLKTSTPSGLSGVRRLESAMSYAVLAGGKRIRPLIVYATFELAKPVIKGQITLPVIDQGAKQRWN